MGLFSIFVTLFIKNMIFKIWKILSERVEWLSLQKYSHLLQNYPIVRESISSEIPFAD